MTKRRAKLLLLAGFIAAGVAIMALVPGLDLLKEVQAFTERLRGLGWLAPALFVPLVAVLTAVGCPRLLLCPVAGMTFGFWPGLLWSQVGTLLGYYGQFVFVRWAGREYVMHKWPALTRLSRISGISGAATVALIRQLPMGGFYLNILLGLTHASHRSFIAGSAVGLLPEAIPATLIGAGAMHFSWRIAWVCGGAAVGALLLVSWLVRLYVAKSRLPGADLVREIMKMNLENRDVD